MGLFDFIKDIAKGINETIGKIEEKTGIDIPGIGKDLSKEERSKPKPQPKPTQKPSQTKPAPLPKTPTTSSPQKQTPKTQQTPKTTPKSSKPSTPSKPSSSAPTRSTSRRSRSSKSAPSRPSTSKETIKEKIEKGKIEAIISPVSKYIVIKQSDAEKYGIKQGQKIGEYRVIINSDEWFEKRKHFDPPKIAKSLLEKQYESEVEKLRKSGKLVFTESEWEKEANKYALAKRGNVVIIPDKETFIQQNINAVSPNLIQLLDVTVKKTVSAMPQVSEKKRNYYEIVFDKPVHKKQIEAIKKQVGDSGEIKIEPNLEGQGGIIIKIIPKRKDLHEKIKYLTIPSDEQIRIEEEKEMIRKIYENASSIDKALMHLRAFFSPQGIDYVISYLPGGKKPEDIVIEKMYETYKHKDDNLYEIKEGIGALFGSVPGIFGTSFLGGYAFSGAVKGAGAIASQSSKLANIGTKISKFIVKHPTLTKATVWGTFSGLEAHKQYTYYNELKKAGIPDEEIPERMGTELTKDILTMIGFTKGFEIGIKGELPIKYGKVTLPSKEGEKILWKGVYISQENKAYPLIGKVGKRIKIGTPRAEELPLEDVIIPKGYAPFSSIETKILARPKVMELLGYPLQETEKVSVGTRIMEIIKNQPSKFLSKEFIKETKTLSKKGVDIVIKHVKKHISKVDRVYGSFVARPQLLPEFRNIRVPGDIDIQLKVGKEEAEKFAKELVKKLRKAGEKVRISPKKSTLIEALGKDGKWHHAIDIHYIGEPAEDLLSPTVEGAYGFKFSQKPETIEGIKVMRLSEHTLRKGASSLMWQENKIFPKPHRVKDIPDFYVSAKTLVESMKKDYFAFLKSGKIKEAEKLLEKWKELYPEINWDKFLKGGEIKIEFPLFKSSLPSSAYLSTSIPIVSVIPKPSKPSKSAQAKEVSTSLPIREEISLSIPIPIKEDVSVSIPIKGKIDIPSPPSTPKKKIEFSPMLPEIPELDILSPQSFTPEEVSVPIISQPSTPTKKPPEKPPTIDIPVFPLKVKAKEKKSQKIKRKGTEEKYSPSLGAVVFDIESKEIPRKVTGIELFRPLPKRVKKSTETSIL